MRRRSITETRTVARETRRRIDAIYRSVASEEPSSLAEAVSAAVRRHRSVAFPLGVLKTTATGSAAGTDGAPFAPSAVHRGRPGAHVHALLVDAPLDSHATQYNALCIILVPRVRRIQYAHSRGLLRRLVLHANTNFQRGELRGESREVS